MTQCASPLQQAGGPKRKEREEKRLLWGVGGVREQDTGGGEGLCCTLYDRDLNL